MELMVLGKSPAMPDAGGAHSGYLITHDGFTLLLDCGGGVFAKLRALADPAAVDAVLVSHLHADHILDLLPFSFALTQHLGGERQRHPPLCAPPGARAAFAAFAGAVGMEDQINDSFDVSEYDPDAALALGPFRIRFRAVPHYIPAWACDLRCEGGRITFGGDCGPNDAIVDLARGTDLLMLEATEGVGPHVGASFRGHLTAGEAADIAGRAGAGRLVLTHYSDLLDADALRAEATGRYGGPVDMAAEGVRYTV